MFTIASSSLDLNSLPPWLVPLIGTACAGMILTVLLTMLANVATIFRAFRRTPPDHAVYATKGELDAHERRFEQWIRDIESRHNTAIGEVKGQITGLQTTLNRAIADVNRALGRVEGVQAHETEP